MKVLFICSYNRCRSVTAEWLYKENFEHCVRSAGLSLDSNVVVSEALVLWADRIFVFEKHQRNEIRKRFSSHYAKLKIECLYIGDLYEPMDPILIDLLRVGLQKYLGLPNRSVAYPKEFL
jgi:predicted protein tyrosine phosphatase